MFPDIDFDCLHRHENVYRKLEIGSRRQLAMALVAQHAGEPVLAGN